ncbi:single-stranded DNA-binding protein [Blastococcus tunisiensis]|uniref:Single-strand DNA-binding protein n=1 Tax=Blastococcus tunisiensis TaxID=1798228 RepID=A0A1I1ZJ72_9ACTN|nr:single-stranded DNA-binding protein [Blastococcus sp. DSM 46838]SFE30603.1 single-strand DNA-binding protein [Blastococcus sp. DSM 46838]
MNDTIVTVVGNVVDSPRRVNLENGAVTNFRLASTARRYDGAKQEFVDAGTFWVDVECWNSLSGNVSASVSKGDPVIVHGALSTHSWESETGTRSKPRIKAFAVGPNLQKGRSLFTRDKTARGSDGADSGADGQSSTAGDPTGTGYPDAEALLSGRDYEDGGATLEEGNPADLPREPAHV